MPESFRTRLQHAWNAFKSFENPAARKYQDLGMSYSLRPDRVRLTLGNERTIISSIYTRIGIDVAAIDVRHVRLDQNGRYIETVKSGLNECLTISANIDQTGRAFMQDVVMSMFDEGVVAIVPVETSYDPTTTGTYEINSLRTGKILEWFPKHVRLRLYNDKTGKHEEIILPKETVAIVENPLFAVMNEPNSTLKRLVHKLNLLDAIDEQSGSGKLDLIIQLPYGIRSEALRERAERRRKDVEEQLANSKFGIAYSDGTEKITQLNRPVENNIMAEIEYLTTTLYSQLGMTKEVFEGNADEQMMLNYYNRTIEPILTAITESMKRTFLTKTARTQGQSIAFFRDPFRLVPINDLADIADRFTRNEILTSNEVRSIIGYKPDMDPRADELRNKNISAANDQLPGQVAPGEAVTDAGQGMAEEEMLDENGEPIEPELDPEEEAATIADYEEMIAQIDELDDELDEIEGEIGGTVKHYASKYYDPQKAHEYYMRTRELKGRTSRLTDEGKAAASYVKKTLAEQRRQKVDTHSRFTKERIADSAKTKSQTIETSSQRTKDQIAKERAKTKVDVENYKQQTQAKIDTIRKSIKGRKLTDAQKVRYQEEIASLRADNKAKRESLQADLSQFSTGLREEHKKVSAGAREQHSTTSSRLREEHKAYREQAKAEEQEAYAQELQKITSDASFQKPKKSKKKK